MIHPPMNKYAGDITCSTPIGSGVTDDTDEVENIEAWAEENLM